MSTWKWMFAQKQDDMKLEWYLGQSSDTACLIHDRAMFILPLADAIEKVLTASMNRSMGSKQN